MDEFMKIANDNHQRLEKAQPIKPEVTTDEAFYLGMEFGGAVIGGFFLVLILIGLIGG